MWDEQYRKDLERRRHDAVMGGGQARIDKQHQNGKLTARERLELLFDEGTFAELCAFREARPTVYGERTCDVIGDGVVVGYGKIGGHLAYASSEDFTVNGGS